MFTSHVLLFAHIFSRFFLLCMFPRGKTLWNIDILSLSHNQIHKLATPVKIYSFPLQSVLDLVYSYGKHDS